MGVEPSTSRADALTRDLFKKIPTPINVALTVTGVGRRCAQVVSVTVAGRRLISDEIGESSEEEEARPLLASGPDKGRGYEAVVKPRRFQRFWSLSIMAWPQQE